MIKAAILLLLFLSLILIAIIQQPAQPINHCRPIIDQHSRAVDVYMETGDAYAARGAEAAASANYACARRVQAEMAVTHLHDE